MRLLNSTGFVKASFNGARCGDSLETILDIKLRSPRSLGGVGSSNDACFQKNTRGGTHQTRGSRWAITRFVPEQDDNKIIRIYLSESSALLDISVALAGFGGGVKWSLLSKSLLVHTGISPLRLMDTFDLSLTSHASSSHTCLSVNYR